MLRCFARLCGEIFRHRAHRKCASWDDSHDWQLIAVREDSTAGGARCHNGAVNDVLARFCLAHDAMSTGCGLRASVRVVLTGANDIFHPRHHFLPLTVLRVAIPVRQVHGLIE